MNITTKFNLGDEVYPIRQMRKEVVTPCVTCDGVGEAELVNGKRITCPACYGRKTDINYAPQAWYISMDSIGEVGKIEVTLYAPGYSYKSEERYMLSSTGVGTGTCWHARDLFASMDEATAECDARNAAL